MSETPKLKEWREKVGGAGFGKERVEARKQFYAGLAALKIEVPNIDAVVNNPKDFGLKAFEDVEKYKGLSRDISREKYKPRSGETLYETLTDYFRKNLEGEITDKKLLRKQVDKEVALTMHYLGKHQRDARGKKINVDLVRRGETVEIRDGRLYIYSKDAEGNTVKTRVEGAYLRKPPAGTAPEEPRPTTRKKLTIPLPPEESERVLSYPEQTEHEEKLAALTGKMAEIERAVGNESLMGGLIYGTRQLKNEIYAQVDGLRLKAKNDPQRQEKVAEFRRRIVEFVQKINDLKQKLIEANNAFMAFKAETHGKRRDTIHPIQGMMRYLDEGGSNMTRTLEDLRRRLAAYKEILDKAGL